MKVKLNSHFIAFMLLLAVASLVGFDVAAQNLPPIIPAINRESGVTRQIKVSNANQNSPIEASAQLRLGQRSYGDGLLKLKNSSDKPILAFTGEWRIHISEGSYLTEGWDYGGGASIIKGGLKLGEDITLPVAGPTNFVVGEPHRIANLSIRITGVVFQDFSRWGQESGRVYHKLERDVGEMRMVAERVRMAYEKSSPQEIAAQLMAENSSWLIPDNKYRILFRYHLLNENKSLRPDTMQRLENILAKLNETGIR